MRYGLRYSGDSMGAIKEWTQGAERAGFDVLWSQELHTSPFVYPSAVAGFTDRMQLGAGIALAFVRSPLSVALTTLDLDRITDGRFILGLGPGVKGLVTNWHGATYGRPAPQLKEYIQLVRLLLQNAHGDTPIQFQGEYYQVDIRGFNVPHAPVRERIPIYAAAMGPGMCRYMAEVADGILGQIMASRKWVEDVMAPNIEIGLERAGRRRGDLDLSASMTIAISKDVKKARRDLAKTVAFYCTVGTYKSFFAHYGFAEEAAAVRAAFREHGGHGPNGWSLVSDEMVDAFHVAGSPDEAREAAAKYEGLADSLIIGPPAYHLEPGESAEYQQAILEAFAR